jgi:hypothetical protein
MTCEMIVFMRTSFSEQAIVDFRKCSVHVFALFLLPQAIKSEPKPTFREN